MDGIRCQFPDLEWRLCLTFGPVRTSPSWCKKIELTGGVQPVSLMFRDRGWRAHMCDMLSFRTLFIPLCSESLVFCSLQHLLHVNIISQETVSYGKKKGRLQAGSQSPVTWNCRCKGRWSLAGVVWLGVWLGSPSEQASKDCKSHRKCFVLRAGKGRGHKTIGLVL